MSEHKPDDIVDPALSVPKVGHENDDESASTTVGQFLTPPEWNDDTFLLSIYLYIRHHHNGDTDRVYKFWWEHARRLRRKTQGNIKANGWQRSWNKVRVTARRYFNDEWPAALRHHYGIVMDDLDGNPRPRPLLVTSKQTSARQRRRRRATDAKQSQVPVLATTTIVDDNITMRPVDGQPKQRVLSDHAARRVPCSRGVVRA